MDLKCYVNGKEYKDKMVQGIVVSEEYNETLDSATVILSQIPKINDLRPYDDFFIYEGEFKGYNKENIKYEKVTSEKLNGFHFDINQKFYDNESADVILHLKIQNTENIPNFFIDFNADYDYHQVTYFVQYHPATEEFPSSITFDRVTESEYYPKSFSLGSRTENDFDGMFQTGCTIETLSNMKTENNGQNITFDFVVSSKYNADFVGYYDINTMASSQSLKLPENYKKTETSVNVTLKKVYFKKEEVKISDDETVFVDIEQKYETKSYYGKLDFIYENRINLNIDETNENFIITFISNFDNNFNSVYGLKADINDGVYDYSFTYIDKINGYVPVSSNNIKYDGFYKHFLVDQYTEEMLNIDDDPSKILYKYKIELFSETKKLETIQIPNFSVTQPQHGGEKKNIYSYIVDVVDMYSPTYKLAVDKNEKVWMYKKKYSVDESLKGIFENLYCPDFTLNNPNFRDVLAQLMLVADRIPYVEDDVIKAMDITQRKGKFEWNKGEITNIVASRTSSNHCDNLKRTYSNALSQENTAHSIEYIGFRNSSSGMLTLENLKLETRFPIYKINKVYMCYYKKVKIISKNSWNSDDTYQKGDKITYDGRMYKSKIDDNKSDLFKESDWEEVIKEKIFLCKQDITALILLDSERNLISQDWTELGVGNINIDTIEKMAQYKFFTLGYNIGSNEINGFGKKYEYFKNVYWDETATYIQNVIVNTDRLYPLGIYDEDYFSDLLEMDETLKDIKVFPANAVDYLKETMITPFTNASLGLKSLVFQIDYNAFYNGTIYHSKDTDRDDIVINDNSSSSLTLLEQDGIHQKEKANRFGNKTVQISSRYKNINDLQPLGSVFKYADEDDVIIYHKQYSIFDNIINCSYSGSKDYVLKNYFTSVYAKHRPYNLMSYGESVRRSENRKMYVNISKDNSYIENQNKKYTISDFNTGSFVKKLLSFFKADKDYYSTGEIIKNDKIDSGYIVYKDKNGKNNVYLSDINAFSSGNSLCFNLSMYDNVSAGLYLDKNQLEPEMGWTSELGFDDKDDYIRGTMQRWYLTVDNEKEGHTRELGFFVGHKQQNNIFNVLHDDKEKVKNIIKDVLFALPKNDISQQTVNKIGDFYVLNKDNKEVIDMTFQIEINKEEKNNDLFYNNLMLQLSDLNGVYNKFEKNLTGLDFPGLLEKNEIFAFSNMIITGDPIIEGDGANRYYAPVIILSSDNEENLKVNMSLEDFKFDAYDDHGEVPNLAHMYRIISKYTLILKKITEKGIDDKGRKYITVSAIQKIKVKRTFAKDLTFENDITMKFIEIENFGITQKPENKIWYSNCEIVYADSALARPLYSIRFIDSHPIICVDDDGEKEYTIRDINASTNFIIDAANEQFTKYNTIYQKFGSKGSASKIVYHKNLYLATSQAPLDKMSVYKQFMYTGDEEKIGEDILIDNSRTPEDVISVEKAPNGIEQLVITIPQEYIDNNVQSIQVWYLDNDDQRYVQNDVFYFVFGVNLTDEDKSNGYVKFNVSVLSARDMRVFDENHKIIGKVKNVANSSEIETEQKYEEQQ